MKLYGTLTSPYVRKVRAFLHEKDVACEFIVEAANDAAGNVARLNPLGKIPVLVRDDGESLFESMMIIEYLDSLRGTPLIPPTGEARWQAQRWHALGQGMLDAVVTRLMETRREPANQDAKLIARQEGKVAATLRFADASYRDTEYLMGDAFTIADVAFGVALEYIDLRYPHDWRAQHPRLAKWLEPIARRPSFVRTVAPKT